MWRLAWIFLAAVICGVLAGCAHPYEAQLLTVTPHQPRNVYKLVEHLPSPIRRVAVLPISVDAGDWEAAAGRDQLQPILQAELGKTRAFEVVMIAPDQVSAWTGRTSWRPDQSLPENLFRQVRSETDCDAVLLTHLGAYHPYQPLVLGWNMRLVEVNAQHILWGVEDVFDSNDPAVAKAALQYQKSRVADPGGPPAAPESILFSPRRFGQYSLHALLQTLPSR